MDVVSKVSNFLGIDSTKNELTAEESRGRIGHVVQLVHPLLMAIGINIAVKVGKWDSSEGIALHGGTWTTRRVKIRQGLRLTLIV